MADNKSGSISLQKDKSASVKETIQALKTRTDLEKKEILYINELIKDLDREVVKSKYQLIKELEEAASKKRSEDYKKEGKILKAAFEDAFGTADKTFESMKKTTSSLINIIDKSLNKYYFKVIFDMIRDYRIRNLGEYL